MTRSLVLRLPFTLGSSRVATRRQRTPGSAESPLQGLSPVRPPQGIEQGQSEVEISKRWISTHGNQRGENIVKTSMCYLLQVLMFFSFL